MIKAGFREGDKADICFVELTIRDESEGLDKATESENTTKEESNVLGDALVETAVEETKEDKPKKAAAKKTETKEDKPKKAAANKAKTKPKKEEEKKSWWSRFKI